MYKHTNILPQIHRGFGLRFLLSVISFIGLTFSTFLQSTLKASQEGGRFYQGYHNELITQALSSDVLSSFLPVLVKILLSAGYLEDVKSKFARFCLIRDSYPGYLFSHCTACWFCGGSTVFLGISVTWGVTTLILPPMEQVVESYIDITSTIITQLLLLFLNGGLWAVLGRTMSTIMESKYIAYASPFIVYYLLVILYERYFPNAWLLYPKNWLDPEIWPYGVGSAALFLLELTFLCGLVFYIRGKRRLEQL